VISDRGFTPPLRVGEVALTLNVHINTVKRIPPSDLPFFRVASRGDRRYRIEDVMEYIRRREAWT
jgi:hypothetical protein